MIEELNKSLVTLNNTLKDLNNIDETQLKKQVYEILRNGLKAQQYELSIDNYYLNINPKDIRVRYEIPSTLIEIDSESTYFEIERDLDLKYFIVSNTKEEYYTLVNPIIQVAGHVLNIDSVIKVDYILKLINNKNNERISNFIKHNNNIQIINDNSALISFYINETTPVIDFKDYLDYSKVIPVYLEYKQNRYTTNIPDLKEIKQYSKILPDISNKIIIMRKICNYIVNFYNDYSQKTLFNT